jgi:hypothetical protein
MKWKKPGKKPKKTTSAAVSGPLTEDELYSDSDGAAIKSHAKMAKGEEVEELWEAIGFHKPLAGFWYNLTFSLVGLIAGLIYSGVLLSIFYPYPESNGYRNVTSGIFSVFLTVIGIGTSMTMDRFIADARLRNPKKMIQYIQYFVWYHAFTGILAMTVISAYALYIVPTGDLSYGVWLMILIAASQYPGFTGAFSNVLGSLQYYHKQAVLSFITGQILNRVAEMALVLWGRYVLGANPAIGEIMGIAIGADISVLVNSFVSMWLSAYYFTGAMKHEGIRVRDCFRVDFDRALVWECLSFGIKTGMPGLIGVISGLIMLYENIIYLPQYATLSNLASVASGISGFVNWGGVAAPTPALAEAYLNGKKKLTQYYVSATIRYITLFHMLFLPMTLSLLFVLNQFVIFFNLTNYLLAIPFFIPSLVFQFQQPYGSFADSIQTGCNRPMFLMLIRFVEETLKVTFTTLWLVILALPIKDGYTADVWIITCGILPAVLFKTAVAYIRIHKHIVPVVIPKWQVFVAPTIACGIMLATMSSMFIFIVLPIIHFYGFIAGLIVGVLILLLVVIFCYMPITAMLGGWDNVSLREFKQAAQMSGPSKFFVWPMYKLTEIACNHSRLFNKYPIESREAMKEARELWEMKKANMTQ